MAENLRTITYNDGTPISGGLSNQEWQKTTSGAYAIYPHAGGDWPRGDIEGIKSDIEMLTAYGALYNWYAVETGKLCPAGWRVAGDEDWTELTSYLISNYENITSDNVGNALKSCSQVGSPINKKCNISVHPRWNANDAHYGSDYFGFFAFPGGTRATNGFFYAIGAEAFWWTSTEYSSVGIWNRNISYNYGSLNRFTGYKAAGYSIRCIRNID